MSFNYSYLTRKQANIVYAAWKAGRIKMMKKDVSSIYDVVGRRELSHAERVVADKAENIVLWLMENRDDLAQAIADGFYVVSSYEKRVRPATEDDFFYELGEDVEESIFSGYELISPEEYKAMRN